MKFGKKLGILVLVIYFLFLSFTRFFNLETTARLVWDESSDLVRMRELYQHPKITLIGPMSEDGVKVFGSLSYYLTLPFVVLFNFDPVSSAYATAFFGVVAVLLMMWFLKKTNLNVVYGGLLLLVSFPLLEASRWAWNPHFIPFWQTLGLLGFGVGGSMGLIASGLFFGLTFHNHYYGLFALVGMMGVIVFYSKRKIRDFLLYLLGVGIALVPFVIFDLTHLPGLFITRLIYFGPLSGAGVGLGMVSMVNNLAKLPLQFATYLAGQNAGIGMIVLLVSGINMLFTWRHKNFKWLLPVLAQLLGLSLIGGGIYNHYLLPAVIFYYLWILGTFEKNFLSKFMVGLLIVSNLWSLKQELQKNDWSTNIKATKEIVEIMATEAKTSNKKFNIAVLGSPDPNTKGRRYRDLLNLRDIHTTPEVDYSSTDVFFVSYLNWSELKNDASYEINEFRTKEPSASWDINNSKWKVYLLRK